MCNSGGSSSSQRLAEEQMALAQEEVQRGRWQEDQRQGRIDYGTSLIDHNFWELDPKGMRPNIGSQTAMNESFEDWQARNGHGVTPPNTVGSDDPAGRYLTDEQRQAWEDGGRRTKTNPHPRAPGGSYEAPVYSPLGGVQPSGGVQPDGLRSMANPNPSPRTEAGRESRFPRRDRFGGGGLSDLYGRIPVPGGHFGPRPERNPGPAPWDPPPTSIFDQREQDYKDWANPQVDQKHKDSRNQLIFQLSDMGRAGGGSTSIDRYGRLDDDYTLARSNVADQAVDLGNQARTQMSDERSRLMGLLHATGDPSAIQGQLGSVIDSIRTAPAFNPIGPLFQNTTAGLGSYLDGRRFSQVQNNVNQTPIYSSPTSGSGRVVR